MTRLHPEIGMDPSEFNRQEYEKRNIAKVYAWAPHLLPGEETVLAELGTEIRGKKILDIGVGGGRTTSFLMNLSKDYLGVDYSAEMVKLAKARTPDAEIRQMDARSLSGLEDSGFDFVLFSFNGIDSVSHPDRLLILESVHRVLKPGGWFAFSSHNLDGPTRKSSGLVYPRFGSGLRTSLGELKRFFTDLIQYRKNRKFEIHGEGFAILNDCAHNYALLNYYVSIPTQKDQLRQAGFQEGPRCFNEKGREVSVDHDSLWIHYLVRKT